MPDTFNGPPKQIHPWLKQPAKSHKSLVDENTYLNNENKYLKKQIVTDYLTGIPNRKYLDEQLENFGNSGSVTGLTAVMFDIDDFSNLNEELGHLGADEILKKIAKVLQENIESTDVLARYGGDELAILLPNLIDEDDVQKFLLRLHASLNDNELKVSFGFSTAIKPNINEPFDFKETLKKADEHLFQIKQYKNLVK